MIRCTACGRENDERDVRCSSCEADLAAALAEGLLAGAPARTDDPSEPAKPGGPQAPRRALAEALAAELCCVSCRTSVPPASRFCGVCGARLDPSPRE